MRVLWVGLAAFLFLAGCDDSVESKKCGDGIKGGDEQCDDGNLVAKDGCCPRCKLEGGWECKLVNHKSVCTKKT